MYGFLFLWGEIGHHSNNPFETDSVHVDPETQELYGKSQ